LGQHEVQVVRDSHVAVHPPQELPQAGLQPKRQGSKQSSERRPRRSFSSKQGRGQQLQGPGDGIGVEQLGAHEVQVGAGAAQVLQPPWWEKIPNPTGLIMERLGVGD